MNFSKSLLFTTAWSIYRQGLYPTFGESLKAAWQEMKLRSAIKRFVVTVTFVKKEGETTTRQVTTAPQYLPFATDPNRKPNPPKAGLIKFYSLTDNGFRSCRIERLKSFTYEGQTKERAA